ncbi:MAG: molybdopterin-guanine dinucleotide biosynthesis protein B, partial [Mesorhizobium sp.]
LTEKLVAELVRRGWKVSTVKHAHHDFDIDKPGADSFRHRQAGATEVAIVSGNRWALMHELRGEGEPPLDAILSRLAPC